MEQAHRPSKGGARLPGLLVLEPRDPVRGGFAAESAASGDDHQRQPALARLGRSGEGLDRVARVRRGHDQGSRPEAGRQLVVPLDDERDAQARAGGAGDQVCTDRGSAHPQHDDQVHVAVPGIQGQACGCLASTGQLTGQVADPGQHPAPVDPGQDGRRVQGDGLIGLERRVRVELVFLFGAAPGLLVGILVAEEVARVGHAGAAAASAIRRPSSRSASTSAGERAST